VRERDRRREDERASSSADEVLERALARWLASSEPVAAGGGGAFTSDELIHRVERAKRNRETVLGTVRVPPRSEP
jgi:hypothetical protein